MTKSDDGRINIKEIYSYLYKLKDKNQFEFEFNFGNGKLLG